jgi:hypothetical protein
MADSCVYANLPRGGLGNKMLVWARALVFAQINGLPLFVSRWAEVKLGPYLRGEKSKRQYWGYFSRENVPGIIQRILFYCLYKKVHEPSIDKTSSSVVGKRLYVYDRVPDWVDYFNGLRGHEDLIRESFFSTLTVKYRDILSHNKAPVVAVHIRRSDFRELNPGEIHGSDCNVRTPIHYYIRAIELIRSEAGQVLPVTIFTDGHEEDVLELLALPDVTLADSNPDIVDLLLMSRAKCIVVSAGSTFSYWAAFLSDALVVTDPGHQITIRSDDLRAKFFEGPVHDQLHLSELFRKNIRKIVV